MIQRVEEWAVYEAEGKYGDDRFVVVKDFGNYAETLMIVDIEPERHALRISEGWTDCGRLSYTFTSRMHEMVRVLSADERQAIIDGIRTAFGDLLAAKAEPTDKTIAKLEAQRDVYKELYEREIEKRTSY